MCQWYFLSFLIVNLLGLSNAFTRNCSKPHECSDGIINCLANEDCLVLCHGINSCKTSTINCPINGQCDIECDNTASCQEAIINGQINNDININCDALESCFSATFNAQHSAILNIGGCLQSQSCLDLSIYCPPNSNGVKNCLVEGNNNLGSTSQSDGIKLYLINGWNDIEIDYNGSFNTNNDYNHFGTMYCTENYDMHCAIALNDWSCLNKETYCNDPTAHSPSTTTTSTTSTNDDSVIVLRLKMNKVLLQIILSLVLLTCVMVACCVWYKIVCVNKQTQEKADTTDNVTDNREVGIGADAVCVNGIVPGSNASFSHSSAVNTVNTIPSIANNISSSIRPKDRRHISVPSKSSALMSAVGQNKDVNPLSTGLAPPLVQARKASFSSLSAHSAYSAHSGRRDTDVADINILQLEGSIRYISDDDIQSELPESPENKDENSDSDLYIPHTQSPQHTPYGTPQQSAELKKNNDMRDDSDMCIQHQTPSTGGQSHVTKRLSMDIVTDVSVGCGDV